MNFNLSLLLRVNQIRQFLLHKVNVFLNCKFSDKFPDILAVDIPNNRKIVETVNDFYHIISLITDVVQERELDEINEKTCRLFLAYLDIVRHELLSEVVNELKINITIKPLDLWLCSYPELYPIVLCILHDIADLLCTLLKSTPSPV